MKSLFLFLISLFSSLTLFAKDTVLVVDIKRGIDPVSDRQTSLALSHAREINADYVIINMDTYGGGVLEADSIRTRILEFEKPIYVFINKNAGSAGSLISIACDSIYMAPGSSFGASTVVNQSGEVVPEKYQSFMRSKMRATAEANNRDPKIAEGMVGLYLGTDSATVIAFTPKEAIDNGYCEGQVESVEDILEKNGITDYTIVRYEPDGTEKVVSFFLNPVVKSILLLAIMGGLYFEMQTPGVGFPLILAMIALTLYFIPDYLHGMLANWEILLFFVGLALLALEIFVIPGFGVAGISGITLIFASLLLSMVRNDVFDFEFVAGEELLRAFGVVSVGVLGSSLLIIFGGMGLVQSRAFKRLTVQQTIEQNASHIRKPKGEQSFVGMEGEAYTVLRPGGKIMLGERIFDASTRGEYVQKGTKVKVIEDQGVELKVRAIS